MRPEDVDFLAAYLAESPELKTMLRSDPPLVRCRGGWKRITGFQTRGSGLLLRLSGGQSFFLNPRQASGPGRVRTQDPFLALMRRWFPRLRVLKVMAGTDRVRRQTAALLRILLSEGEKRLAALFVYPLESPQLQDRLLSSLILWWNQLRKGSGVSAALVFIPESWSERLLQSLPFLRIPVTCYKYLLDPGVDPGRPRQIYPEPARRTELKAPYVIFSCDQKIPAVLREGKELDDCLQLRLHHGRWNLFYLGLPVAWQASEEDECCFDSLHPTPLRASSRTAFKRHLELVKSLRRFPSPDPQHPYFRLQPERWLESLILKDHRCVNPRFSQEVYSQVPTYVEGERKVLDLLTVTTEGRLAVLEIKLEKDLGLIFQALDYWERVDTHLQRGDFPGSGYFRHLTLRRQSPLLYLICPLFEFHPILPLVRRYLSPRIRFQCIGINADWRTGVRVLRRFEF